MTTVTSTARSGATSNQLIIDNLINQLKLGGGNRTINVTYINVSGGEEDVVVGQVMGVIAASGKWTVCKSGATDGSQFPRGIYLSSGITGAADQEEVEGQVILNSGDVNRGLVVFDGTDTFDTLVDGVRMEDQLIALSQGMKLVNVSDDSEYDN